MSALFTRTTSDPEHSRALGAALARLVVPLPPGGLVWDLRGPLGAGKTAFVQGIARGLGVSAQARVVSPTYTIARSYPCGLEGVEALHHLDAYRLSGPDDLEACGFEEMCGDGLVTCVEWGARVESDLPADRLLVRIDVGSASERTFRIEATGPQADAVRARWSEVECEL